MNPFLHLEYNHISNYETNELLGFSDDWCGRITDEIRRNESLLARLLLNKICKKTIHQSIDEAAFSKKENGMPYFIKHPELFISITHCQGHVWTAMANSPIGIDFEKIDPACTDDLKIAFDDNDWEMVSGDCLGIYKYFSLKESYAKMTGTGFTQEPASIKLSQLQAKTFINIFENKTNDYIFTLIAQNFDPNYFINLNQGFPELAYE